MKKLYVLIFLMCALSSLSHAQLQPNASIDGERSSESPGLELPANTSSSDLDNPSKSSEYDVLRHQKRAMNVLLGWSGVSMITGSVMLFNESRNIRDFGVQNVAWGAIDGGIALYARNSISRKRSSDVSVQEEKENFGKLLLINSLLDVAYVQLLEEMDLRVMAMV